MTERELQTALERLAPREPAQTHEDFLRAVWSAEGETKRMKKQLLSCQLPRGVQTFFRV